MLPETLVTLGDFLWESFSRMLEIFMMPEGFGQTIKLRFFFPKILHS